VLDLLDIMRQEAIIGNQMSTVEDDEADPDEPINLQDFIQQKPVPNQPKKPVPEVCYFQLFDRSDNY